MEQVQDAIPLKYYLYKTEKSYIGWIRRYIFFHGFRFILGDVPDFYRFLVRSH
ncbi:phage integrase N-terminal SAM-like domain-containing protein [Calothrix sp. PCC 6303]|uniref:phage integrase N-terminal SAM-like domain-containing protein n=1 Tax=Calothrix sp. PCC 6303 TaxID=1170562 RepID=UPI0039EFE5E7